MKIFKNWLTHPVFPTPPALRQGLVGAVSFQNTIMAAHTILDNSHNTQQVKKVVYIAN